MIIEQQESLIYTFPDMVLEHSSHVTKVTVSSSMWGIYGYNREKGNNTGADTIRTIPL